MRQQGKLHASTKQEANYRLPTMDQPDNNDIRIRIEVIRNSWKARIWKMLAKWLDNKLGFEQPRVRECCVA